MRASSALALLRRRALLKRRLPLAAPGRSPWWVEGLIIAWLLWVYDLVNNLAPPRAQLAVSHAWGIWHLEQSANLGPELDMNRWLSSHRLLASIFSYYYDNAHFVVTLGLLAWLWWRRTDSYRPFRNGLVAVNLVGFAVFWLYPLAPPRMLLSAGFSDVVASSHTLGSWHTGSLASSADQYAAMPSLHIAWALWCSLVLWRLSTRLWVRAAALTYPCLTTAVVLATGNHFTMDVLAGVATLAAALALVRLGSLWGRALARRLPAMRVVGLRPGLAWLAVLARVAVSRRRLAARPTLPSWHPATLAAEDAAD